VRVLDNFSTGKRANLEPSGGRAEGARIPAPAHGGRVEIDAHGGRVEIVEGDIRDLAACRRACDGVAIVFHQAALGSVPRSLAEPAATIEVNVAGTANVFTAARDAGVRRVVYASSSSVYGDSERLPKREPMPVCVGIWSHRPRSKRQIFWLPI
jgi:nucleoside-diphosphate-sugar epimerase